MAIDVIGSMGAFAQWMDILDGLVWDQVGCSVHDLPDTIWYGYFADNLTEEDALEMAIEDGLLD